VGAAHLVPADAVEPSWRRLDLRGAPLATFNPDLPIDWMLTVLLELMHPASREVADGRLPETKAERALIASITGALAAKGPRKNY
jgi:hypothetical protein